MAQHSPRITLNKYTLDQQLHTDLPSVFTEPFTLENFRRKFKIVIINIENCEMEFDMIGIHPAIVNSLRRIMLSEVASMAVEKVYVSCNTSIIPDEVLAHRLGLIPFKADPRLFEFAQGGDAPLTENDSLEFELKLKCSYNKDANKKHFSRVEDMYKNNNVYSKHFKWVPIGNQREKFHESDVGPVEPDILIVKMRPGHEMDLKVVLAKGFGKDHAKFSPVATAFYRMLPEIKLVKEIEGEMAYRFQKCFSPGVIGIKKEDDGRNVAVVKNSRYDTSSRNVFRYDDLKDAVEITKVKDHFIFTIESAGAMMPDIIFKEAVMALRSKCIRILEPFKNLTS